MGFSILYHVCQQGIDVTKEKEKKKLEASTLLAIMVEMKGKGNEK